MKAISTPTDSPGQSMRRKALLQFINGSVLTQLLHVVAKLGVADLLAVQPRSNEELARALKVDERALFRVMRAAVMLGVFSENQGLFELTTLGSLLETDHPDSLRSVAIMFGEDWWWRPYGALYSNVETGETAFDQIYGKSLFEYLADNGQANGIFGEAMRALTNPCIPSVVSTYDFSAFRTIVDVGGGNGSVILPILEANLQAHGILFDMPTVVEAAREKVRAAGLEERCEVVGGDFFQSVPEGGDAYILKGVIHDWTDDLAISILTNCRKAIQSSGKVLLVELDLPEGDKPSPGKLTDITMLTITGGLERTISEYESLFRKAGFKLSRVISLPNQMNIIEGVPD